MGALTDLMSRGRSPRSGPEDNLCKAVLKSRLPTDKRLQRVVFREPKLPTGYPDIVAVYPTSRTLGYSNARRRLTAEHIRVMHVLHWCHGASLDCLSEMLSCSSGRLTRTIEHLHTAGMVMVRGAYVSPRALSDLFVARRIVAIEFKISDWAKAIEQARANTWFASHSYILIRPHRSLDAIVTRASKVGVGVMLFDGEAVRTALEAAEHAIPASYGSWLLNEWTMDRLQKRKKR